MSQKNLKVYSDNRVSIILYIEDSVFYQTSFRI